MRRSTRNLRPPASQESIKALTTKSPATQSGNGEGTFAPAGRTRTRKRPQQDASSDASDGNGHGDEYVAPSAKPLTKKRKIARSGKNGAANAAIHQRLFSSPNADVKHPATCTLPNRSHTVAYHRPLLLDSQTARTSLLTWFDGISTARSMPWRKPWIDSRAIAHHSSSDDTNAENAAELRQQLERRAYEVWISEIMLQQTRVAVVIDYWKRWMASWPTIHSLAAAEPDAVLAAWRGLGYYSRATRIHEAAKLVCGDPDMGGLLPVGAEELAAKVPGVGRYTAGAISAIVFGRAAPMVDGNVLRVLSRQLGLFGDVKADKSVIDLLWAAADGLVKAVVKDSGEDGDVESPGVQVSDRPGRWGQALMELGSTICTPKPNCAACPISSSCRAYAEGLELARRKGLVPEDMMPPKSKHTAILDIEDACSFCKPFEEFAQNGEDQDVATSLTTDEATPTPEPKSRSRKQATLQSFAFTQSANSKQLPLTPPPLPGLNPHAMEVVTSHARKFPVKVIKKAVRQEETLVCAIRRSSDSRYLIHRRPAKGLLAGLWELPSYILPDSHDSTPKSRKKDAEKYVSDLLDAEPKGRSPKSPQLRHACELGRVPWLFSHLKLTMHVHLFHLDGEESSAEETAEAAGSRSRWSGAVDEESMGTGMHKCWALVKEKEGQ
ncbi:Uu.00g067650.m01.CDS01 [Anthostomella pinea]|uniref:Adenine DNA glycosylase n=1 Tax=Anthostomella pinea TaxID=933095 RepID=A0AAI8VUT8_9PEZI|nr:Uu.00g067650.m01.CDS01 [Anthostomella pinea]